LTRLRVEATDEMVDKEWERLMRQQGKLTEVPAIEAGDLVYGKFVELDETGEIKPGGLFQEGVINQDMVKDEAMATRLLGMAIDQHVDFVDLAAALDRTQESIVKHLLNAKDVDHEGVGHAFRMTVTGIKRSTPPEVTPEWLQSVFGSEEVKDELAARDIIRREIERAYAQRTDRYFNDQLVEHFLENTTIPLPEEFLGRWLLREKRNEAKEGEAVPERLDDEEFAYFQRNLKWSLIYNKVARDRDLSVPQEELEQAVRSDVHRHYGPAVASLEEEDIKGLVGRLMGDREYLEKVHGNLLDQKVFGAIHDTITIQDEPTTLEAFEKRLSGNAE
jgi:trigger factor